MGTKIKPEEKTFDNSADMFLGSRLENIYAALGNEVVKMKRHFYFQNKDIWANLMINYAAKFFTIGDKVLITGSANSIQRIETDKVVIHREGNKYLIDIKGGEVNIDLKIHWNSTKIHDYMISDNTKVTNKSIFQQARYDHNIESDKTGYWHVPFIDKNRNIEFVSALRKIAKTNADILNVYFNEFPNVDKIYIVRIYCLQEKMKSVSTLIKEIGVKGEITFVVSKRSAVENRKFKTLKIK